MKDTAQYPKDRVIAEKFAKNLTDLRARTGLSQADVADRAGISETWLAQLEAGEGKELPLLGNLLRIAAALGAGLGDLAEGMTWTPPNESAGTRGQFSAS